MAEGTKDDPVLLPGGDPTPHPEVRMRWYVLGLMSLAFLVSGCRDVTGLEEPDAGPRTDVTVAATAAHLNVTAVATGANHSCGLTPGGETYCWGQNQFGQLGNGTTDNSAIPVAVAGGLTFTALAAGGFSTCGLTGAGDVYCWGWNNRGQLGDGTFSSRTTPVRVQANGIRFTDVSIALLHTCALSDTGEAYCWGDASHGKLGTTAVLTPCPDSPGPCTPVPVPVSGGLTFQSISVSPLNTCAVTPGGDAYCWGSRTFGAIGDGMTTGTCPVYPSSACAAAPVLVPGGLNFQSISSGGVYTCGLTTADRVYCWGTNFMGNLGVGSTATQLTPTPVVGGHTFTFLTTAGENNVLAHTCAITPAGDAYCWGANYEGQLGTTTAEVCAFMQSSLACSTTPVPVSGSLKFRSLDAGSQHTCGVSTDGIAYCWGWNLFGQLGNGTVTGSTTPVPVVAPAAPPCTEPEVEIVAWNRGDGSVDLNLPAVNVGVFDIERYIPRRAPGAGAQDLRLGDNWITATPAERFEVGDLNADRRRDVLAEFDTERLLREGNLSAETTQVTLWGRNPRTGELFCGTTSVSIVD